MTYALHQTSAPYTAEISAFRLSKISLANFRNYQGLRIEPPAAPVILTGANGSGKTNILEAISLLVPGRGLRRAAFTDFQNHEASSLPWAVAVELDTRDGLLNIGTGRDPDPHHVSERRVVHINGKAARNQQQLAELVPIAWVTPDMDRTLADGAAARRKLLDRLVYSFDPAHNGRIHRYEKAMRERLRLLREGRYDQAWLNALEDELAQSAVAIAAARKHLVQQLRIAIDETTSVFPRADLMLSGQAEEGLDAAPALLVEDNLRAAYAAARRDDAQSGTCAVGTHRSDLLVVHRAKRCPADLCSTGEQKALMIAIMLAYVRTLIHARSCLPLFLLDDIAAHLDDMRRAALFEEIRTLKVQAWLTGTNRAFFDELLPYAQHYQVESGRVQEAG